MMSSIGRVLLVALLVTPPLATAQEHVHGPASGIPHGIPELCPQPTVTSVSNGAWSSAATWSTGKVPAGSDAILIASNTAVVYDVVSDAALKCIDVAGTLAFRPDVQTRMTVGTVTVLEQGTLEVGTLTRPIADTVTAELVIADTPIDTRLDPDQLGGGVIGLGTVTMQGSPKSATFIRLAKEPLAGQQTLELEDIVTGWNVGDRLVIPDTRQLRQNERGESYQPQWEELTIGSVAGRTIALASPMRFDHHGARNSDGLLEFLPHVGNLSRNVIVRSQNPSGTRGHTIFIQHPTVDIRYAEFRDMGRTRAGVLNDTEWGADGAVRHIGTNQIGRYAIHFHHAFGPVSTPASGYQFTLIGNAVVNTPKWGITVHNSHYGLIRDNVVYNSRGAAIVAEDGTESFNVFEHNFAMRSEGSGEFAPRSGYGGATNDPGGEGAGFWLRGPNNILRHNVAANVDVFGYALAAGGLGTVRIPKFKGADTSNSAESVEIDTTDTTVIEFSGNEAYGAIQTGIAIGWNATLADTRVWHTSRHAITAFPTDRLTIDGFIARGDVSVLQRGAETPTGVWFGNYAAKVVTVKNANVQGMRVGVASPFIVRVDTEPGRGDGVATIENSYFRDYVGVAVSTAYSQPAVSAPIKKAIIRSSRFDPLVGVPAGQYPPAAISMNYGTQTGDLDPRDPVIVYDLNGKAGDTFRVFYSHELPASAAPACSVVRPEIDGFVCPGDDGSQESRR